MDKHKIVAIIKGEKHTLNQVGEPDPDMVDDPYYKLMLRAYVLNNFKKSVKVKMISNKLNIIMEESYYLSLTFRDFLKYFYIE